MASRLGLIVLMCALGACSGDRTPRPPKVDDPENQATLAKLQGYIGCLEAHTKRVFELGDLVRSGARSVRPTPKPDSCIAAIEAAKARTPALADAETAAAAFAAALTSVHSLSSAGEKLEEPARAQLLVALDQFDAAQGALFDIVRRRNREVHLDQLARKVEKEGPTLALVIESMIVHSEGLIEQAATTADRLDALDLARLSEEVGTLEVLGQQMSARAAAEPKEVGAFDNYYNLAHHYRTFVVATRQLIARARDRVAYSDAEKLMIAANNESAVAGTPAAAVAAYNNLIEAYGVR